MCGAKALRRLFLFEKAILLTKEREDGVLLVKSFILVRDFPLLSPHLGDDDNVSLELAHFPYDPLTFFDPCGIVLMTYLIHDPSLPYLSTFVFISE